MAGFDYQGASIFVGSLAGAVTLVGGFALQVATFLRQGARDAKIEEVHRLVNGQSAKLEVLTFKAGEVSGADKERATPTTGNHPVA